MPDRKHVEPPEARACWAGEEEPTLNVVFTNRNQQILHVLPLSKSAVKSELKEKHENYKQHELHENKIKYL